MRTHASKPTPITLLLTLMLAIPMLSTNVRADELVMPYTCQMVGGRPLLVASSPQTYRITGNHDQRKITVCSPADPSRCRAWNVHSFNLNCGGSEISWPAFIAGSPPARDGRARLENGRFQLSMPPAWNLPSSDPCARQMDTPAPQRDPQLERYCSDRPDLTRQSSVEMPAGFAPTLGLDVKFITGNSAPVASAARPDPGLTAQTPAGGLTWKASPVAPPQPGSLQAGVPFDPASPPAAPAKKQPPEIKSAARAEPALKPALPPIEQPASARPSSLPEPRSDVVPPRTTAVDRSALDHPADRPSSHAITPPAPATAPARATPTAPAPVAATPPIPAPAAKPVEPPAPAPSAPAPPTKITALPQPEPAPRPAPVAPPPPAAAPMPVIPPQTATSESTKSTQVAESMTKQEPYSSRPQKLTPPNSGFFSLTNILLAAGLALSALGTFFWLRRERGEEAELPDGPRVYAGPGFNSGFDNDTRTIPNLSGPMSADGLHRSASAHALGPAFGPYGQHIEPAFDHPLGPILPEWPNQSQDAGHDHPRLEPAFSEPDPAHDWTAPNEATASQAAHGQAAHSQDARHALDIPARDEPREPDPIIPAENESPHHAPSHPPTAAPASLGAAVWPSEMPQTHDDALHILGLSVASKASLTAMKKIVDGLRQNWHPDLATDDADRAIRDLRTRQIDTAWDIIITRQRPPPPNDDPVI